MQLAVNPANLINAAPGIFFTFGAASDNKVIAGRTNYKDLMVTDEIQSASSGHVEGSESYIIEVKIPWDLMKIKVTKGQDVDTTSFKPEKDTTIGLLPCVIDSESKGIINAAYRHENTNFNTKYFVPAKLTK